MFENEDLQDGPLAREDGMRFRRIVGKCLIYGMVIHLMEFCEKIWNFQRRIPLYLYKYSFLDQSYFVSNKMNVLPE